MCIASIIIRAKRLQFDKLVTYYNIDNTLNNGVVVCGSEDIDAMIIMVAETTMKTES